MKRPRSIGRYPGLRGLIAGGLVLVANAVIAAELPLSLDDIAARRGDGQGVAEVIREVRTRGRSFELDAVARERLAGLGFTPRQLEVIGKAKQVAGDVATPPVASAQDSQPPDGQPADTSSPTTKPPTAKAAAAKSSGAKPAGPASSPQKSPVAREAPGLERSPEDVARLERLDTIVKQAAEAARGVTVVDAAHTRLVLGSGVPPGIVDDVRKLEALIDRHFPGPVADGVDKRGVAIAIFATESEHAGWVTALDKALQDNGVQIAAGATTFAEQARCSPAMSIDGITTMRITGGLEEARRMVAHAVGFHALPQLTRGHCLDALQSGFANVTETMLFGSPGTTAKGGYVERELGAAGTGWPQLVKQRFATGTAGTAGDVLGYTFDIMEMPHYAECWSFTTVLCMKPEKFTQLVTRLREGGQPLAVIGEVYGGDAAALTAAWKSIVLAGP
ncbi:MAG: hypothetical protein FJ284_08550 [Planctomycetes bacterium]|nr:hypothetical protein [Planctomycetota bacterium]MBM4056725.1 hypothetical protein [Planctomycetota bacterium]